MAQITTFLQPLRFRVSLTSKASLPAISFCGKFKPVKTWMNGLQSPAIHFTPSTSNWKLYLRRYLDKPKIRISGFKFSMWSILGGSVVLGLVSFCSGIAYSMDGFHILLDDHSRVGLSGASDFEEDQHTFLAFAKKIMAALFLVATVFTNWDHPVKLAAKLTVILLSSKPSPSSVYFVIEKWRDQYMRQHPLWYKVKPLYAKQVEVEDYKFLCVARVELQDQKFTLIGIMVLQELHGRSLKEKLPL